MRLFKMLNTFLDMLSGTIDPNFTEDIGSILTYKNSNLIEVHARYSPSILLDFRNSFNLEEDIDTNGHIVMSGTLSITVTEEKDVLLYTLKVYLT